MLPLSLLVAPHVIVCLLAAGKLRRSYLRGKDENVRDFQMVYATLGIYFVLQIILGAATRPPFVIAPFQAITEALLTVPILFFFRIVFRILEKPSLSKVIQTFAAGFIVAEIAFLSFVPRPSLFMEIPPFFYWRYSYSYYSEIALFMLFDLVRITGGVAVMALFFWLGRTSAGALRKRFLFIASGFLLLPGGLAAGILTAVLLPTNLFWIAYLVGISSALVGLLLSLAGVYYKIPQQNW
ncbi:MAG: hypothetical protein A3J30_04180 [Candidatus Wildermuthbacteria bacterium RIFCSPLOWO2_02_FULL_47_9c]|uniref:Uncharacterized protein n=2 Tax=Parcubacteria group TaxID=1794811 RepID=A0A837ISK0_9BACT|nr:MAG: hypothetical protein UY25_C0002G0070 [Candidatus Yanofskybacteria bacterium GW2011_GWC1_48_11]KKW04682.1 MAG: hypothetical protein UY38_C0001G0249 [Parcubacteria group bacterium GW2011_GWB1_49_12]KKW09018.1 MAG: hypothetical protein UY45_C0002G0070 [Parcubacteria group bacterium GW2011_GWA1_49_26]KKW14212.1 MAG: hypothetical protein UY53_C0002G0001 [Parcubacteria group bacterium GW2011_GWA2_50_10]OHA61070.1 MAG: hypothetical protein A2109_02345 [Candidatus Wildermuthbacteria bacterium G